MSKYHKTNTWKSNARICLNKYIDNPPKNCQKDKCWFWNLYKQEISSELGNVYGSYCDLLERFNSPVHPICTEFDFTKKLLELL